MPADTTDSIYTDLRAQLRLPGLDPEFKPKREGPIVGIDLGTTNSCVSVVRGDKPMVISSRQGTSTIPSVVAVSDKGKLLVGQPARELMILNPTNTVYGSKRLVGRPFDSPLVGEVKLRTHYNVVAGPDGQAAVKLGEEILTLEEVAALILREARELAEEHLHRSVHRAVITCPAFYNEHQRAAVRRAGHLAGFHVERVLNEPTAAALAFGYGKGLKRRVAIFDLGGGTFDATVLAVDGDSFEVQATGGDTFLGGVDFDHQIVDLLLKAFKQQHGVFFKGDRVAVQRIRDAAETAKQALGEYTKYHLQLPHLTTIDDKPYDLTADISREQVNEVCSPLVERCIQIFENVLEQAGIGPKQVDDVILVGGSTRMLQVQERLKRFFGKDPNKGVHPDEAVAVGAALLARALEQSAGIRLVDVNPMTIGVGLASGRFHGVLPRNQALPCEKTYVIATSARNQRSLDVQIYQGESPETAKNEHLGTLLVDGLPKGPKGTVKVEVSFKLSGECVLSVGARELSRKTEVHATMATKGTPVAVTKRLSKGPRVTGTVARVKPGLWNRIKSWFGR
ncbi:MAG: Hsp70 family protein [Pseudomonadota bacterium]